MSFDPTWLTLRRDADCRARAPALARRFAGSLPQGARLADLGAGLGANLRVLARWLPKDTRRILVDHDPVLLATALADPALRGCAGWLADLAVAGPAPILAETEAVTAAALLDLVSADWLDALLAGLKRERRRALFVLTTDGRRLWLPTLPEDAAIAAGFARHHGGDKGFGPALGGGSLKALRAGVRRHRLRLICAPSDWRLDARDTALLARLIQDEALIAQAGGCPRSTAENWEATRRAQLAAGTLRLTIGHGDTLIEP